MVMGLIESVSVILLLKVMPDLEDDTCSKSVFFLQELMAINNKKRDGMR